MDIFTIDMLKSTNKSRKEMIKSNKIVPSFVLLVYRLCCVSYSIVSNTISHGDNILNLNLDRFKSFEEK